MKKERAYIVVRVVEPDNEGGADDAVAGDSGK